MVGGLIMLDWLLRLFRPAPPAPPRPLPPPDIPPPVASDELLELFNRHRALVGLGPVKMSPALEAAARSWAATMARTGRMSHDGWPARARSVAPNRASGEIVAQGQQDDAQVVADWIESPGHRAIILGGRFNAVGWSRAEGRSGPFWCAIFADLEGF